MTIPGLVDLQVNGYRGADFSGATLEETDVAKACRELLSANTTAFLATLITSPTEVYQRNLPIIASVLEDPAFQRQLLGIHLEGPFISSQDGARGAHNADWTRRPNIDYMKRLVEWADGKVKLITIAAELPGADELAHWAREHGIAVSLGHQMANEKDLAKLARAGARSLTHLGNGLPATIDRHANPLWAGLGNDDLAAMMIADGHHLPPALLKTIIRTKGPDNCILVSDASPLAGLPPGSYESMGARVQLDQNGKLYNPATGYMAGSSATLQDCVDYLMSLNLVTQEELAAMVFDNPLRLIGITPDFILTQDDTASVNP